MERAYWLPKRMNSPQPQGILQHEGLIEKTRTDQLQSTSNGTGIHTSLGLILAVIGAMTGAILTIGCATVNTDETSQYVSTAPPTPLVEEQPRKPGPRHAWSDGHWRWSQSEKRYIWNPGKWLRIRHPHHRHWIPGKWEKKPEGWLWIAGRWR